MIRSRRAGRATSDRARQQQGEAGGASGTPRYLSDSASGGSEPVTIQREGETDSTLPSPSFQLTPPSLLQPRDPYAQYMPDLGLRLRMDPELQIAMAARARLMLSPSAVLAGVAPLLPPVIATPRTDSSGSDSPLFPPTLAPQAPGTLPTPTMPEPAGPLSPITPATPDASGPAPTGGGPTVPGAGASPSPDPPGPRPASSGDVLSAVLALPQVSLMLDNVKNDFTSDLSRYWEGADTGERAMFVTSSVIVTSAVLAPVLGFEGPRDFVLPRLNGLVIPVPMLSGYGLEFNFGENSVMVGAHVDVGVLLPSFLGFGPASFNAIGGPPAPAAWPPVSPKEALGESVAPAPDLADRVRGARGAGDPLPEPVRRRFEAEAGSDLRDVRVHTGGGADRLARDTRAVALTSGSDIFFRAGAYEPTTDSGTHLLAHELAHVDQQARGDLPPAIPGTAVRMGIPGDALEREADRSADALVQQGRSETGDPATEGLPGP